MLTQITIHNYVLIKELEIDFRKQLNIITGETGAGKSILLGALGLLLGNRADSSSMLDQEKKCVIEGSFEISNYNLKPFFDRNELDWESHTTLRREISPSGKSRAFINDTPVNLTLLKELGERLVDIHSQHQTIKLTTPGFQLSLLDAFANHKELLDDYGKTFRQYKKKVQQINTLKESAQKAKKDFDYNLFQLNEIDAANLQPDEQEKLDEELNLLSNADSIQNAMQQAVFMLYEDEQSICNQLQAVKKQISGIANLNSSLATLHQRIDNLLIESKDIFHEAQDLHDNISVDNERMMEVSTRLQTINNLLTKHQATDISQLLAYAEELRKNVSSVENLSEEITKLEKGIAQTEKQLHAMADTISKNRSAQIPSLEEKLVSLLKQVGIPEANIIIKLQVLEQLTENGRDKIDILFSANKGSRPDLVSNAASGGELSRLMLCFKYILADHIFLPTIIFDEIDTGISGEVAIKVGNIIRQLSGNHQVVCITHLPQIAAMGNHHFLVFKKTGEDITQTHMRELTNPERIEEIAKMLAGHRPSQLAIDSAKELLAGYN